MAQWFSELANHYFAIFSFFIAILLSDKTTENTCSDYKPCIQPIKCYIYIFPATDWLVATNGMTTTEYIKFTCAFGTTITFPNILNGSAMTYSFSSAGK